MPPKSASLCVNMDSEKRTEVIHGQDMNYQDVAHKSDLLVKEEQGRRLRLRSMLLRDENASLKDQIAQRDSRLKSIAEQVEDTRAQLESVQEKSRRQEKLLQTQAREVASLREELSSFTSVSQDSAKLLSEKLALSREVAVLKPEIEHLRSQLVHQKDVLAEKLAVERQLNALEVELANEKRAARKAAQKQDRESADESDLQKQVQELEKQLAKEKKAAQNIQTKNSEAGDELESVREQLATLEKDLAAEKRKTERLAKTKDTKANAVEEELEQLRQNLADAEKALAAEKRAAQRKAKNQESKPSVTEDELVELQEKLAAAEQALSDEKREKARLRKEHEQMSADVEARQEAFEAKLERLRTKWRATQGELEQCRSDLEKAQEQAVTIPKVTTTTVPIKKAAKAPAKKKRNAKEMEANEALLHTPGQDDRPKRPLKKRGFDPSIVEKSNFSITPFLNKTVNLSDGSPKTLGEDATRTMPVFNFRNGGDDTINITTTAPTSTVEEPAEEGSAPKEPATKAAPKPRAKAKAKPLADAAPSKKNLTARARKALSSGESTLEKVTEEPDEHDNQNQENRSTENTTKTGAAAPAEAEPKKKKRKLLGGANKPTLFDEDEGERVVPAAPVAAAAAAVKRAKMPSGGVRGLKAAAGVGGAKKNAFAGAAFSPLKRDRRGVGASFLA
ncbi:hypothetical protein B0T25DRAFT_549988 [Lasiosphaeria hispida]|uniref:Rossmann-fold NAD(P)(+)-binding protein n=1 Tax=Lasiosphaeria hispida TaxID=260671 RepID=A0AAJ0HGF2_9PEZI|nr:hypothetical protein B0T25DRAFT_549988 [Lasiosphaeria hispida]